MIFLESADGRLLMQLRSGTSYGGTWGLFGGWMENGETHQQAILREMEEELSLRLDPVRLTHLTPFDVPSLDATAHLFYYAITPQELDSAVLREGQRFQLMTREDIDRLEMASFYRNYLAWYWDNTS